MQSSYNQVTRLTPSISQWVQGHVPWQNHFSSGTSTQNSGLHNETCPLWTHQTVRRHLARFYELPFGWATSEDLRACSVCLFNHYIAPTEVTQQAGTVGQVNAHFLPGAAVGPVLPSERRDHKPGSPGRRGTVHQLPAGRQEVIPNPSCDPAPVLLDNSSLEV